MLYNESYFSQAIVTFCHKLQTLKNLFDYKTFVSKKLTMFHLMTIKLHKTVKTDFIFYNLLPNA